MNPKRIADLTVLLDETPLTYYWMGFLIADGHFSTRGEIKLHLSEKDRIHLEKYRMFIEYCGTSKSCIATAMNPSVVSIIKNKFKLSNRKTYEPCDFTWIKNKDLMFSLICGMLDGDGSVRFRNNNVSAFEIKLHGSWFKNLQFVEIFLYDYFSLDKTKELTRIRKDGYSVLILSDRYLLSLLKKKAEEFSLPVMERKWGKIDLQYQSIYREHKKRLPKILSLIEKGLTYKKIGCILGVSEESIATTIHRLRKKNENICSSGLASGRRPF